MLNTVKLNDKRISTIIGGQIMTRLTAKEESGDSVVEERRIMIPKCILSDGTIDVSELPVEKLKSPADEKKITRAGDIVIKLSTPYDSAIVTEDAAGCLVPSFCAIIRCNEVKKEYLQAFLSTTGCKNQLKNQVAGAIMTILSVGKLGNVDVPDADEETQIKIGQGYIQTQEKIAALKRIVELEAKRNDIIFKDLVK